MAETQRFSTSRGNTPKQKQKKWSLKILSQYFSNTCADKGIESLSWPDSAVRVNHTQEGGWHGLFPDCSSSLLWCFWVWPDDRKAELCTEWHKHVQVEVRRKGRYWKPQRLRSAGRQTGRWFKQAPHKVKDLRPFRTKQQMVDKEAAWHALTLIQVYRGGKRQRPRATAFISSTEALGVCMSGAICSKVILFFYSSGTEPRPRNRITESLRLYSLWQGLNALLFA